MRIQALIFILSCHFTLLAADLPLDKSAIVNELPNGLKYYIRKNAYPKGKGYFRMIVKVGSLNENENERGLAHFLEHMAFRGSKHFKDYEFVRYLESIGAKFGPDINAFTTFDTTEYTVDFPITNETVLSKILLNGSDIIEHLTLDEKLFDIERGVILSEARSGKSAQQRKDERIINFLLKRSKYFDRLPIGVEEVIQTAPVSRLEKFYRKWYRTDNVGLVIVGDFDPSRVEELIKKYYSPLERRLSHPAPSKDIIFPGPKKMLSITDEELRYRTVEFCFPFKIYRTLDQSHLLPTLYYAIWDSLLNQRLGTLSNRANSPVLYSRYDTATITADYGYACLTILPLEGCIREAIELTYQEIQGLTQYGISQDQFQACVEEQEKLLQKEILNLNHQTHQCVARSSENHFKFQTPMLDPRALHKKLLEHLKHINVHEFNEWLLEVHESIYDATMILSSNQKEEITSEEILALRALLVNRDVAPLPAIPTIQKVMQRPIFPPGNLVRLEKSVDKKALQLEFANGVKVTLVPTDIKQHQFLIEAVAQGGYGAYDLATVSNITLAAPLLTDNGLMQHSHETVMQLLASRGIDFDIEIARNLRTISLSASKEEFDLVAQILSAVFIGKSISEEKFKNYINQAKTIKSGHRRDPKSQFDIWVSEKLFSDHPLFKPECIEFANFKLANKGLTKCFSQPSEFHFFVLGDFDTEVAIESLRKWIGCFPKPKERTPPKIFSKDLFPKKQVNLTFRVGIEDNPENEVYFPVHFSPGEQTQVNLLAMHHLAAILNQRLRDTIRKEKGEGYTVSVRMLQPYYPAIEFQLLRINALSTSENAEAVKRLIIEEIRKMQTTNPPTVAEIHAVNMIAINERQTRLQSLSGLKWSYLMSYFHDVPIQEMLDPMYGLDQMTPQLLQEAAQKIPTESRFAAFTHKNEEPVVSADENPL